MMINTYAQRAPKPTRSFDEDRFEQRERWRLRILEAITTGAPLAPILDRLVRSVRKEAPEVICSVLEDLLKAKNSAEAASKTKSQFIALMSHELRTPLNPVKMILHEWKSNPALPDALAGDLEVLQQQIDAEIKVISDLLAIAELGYSNLKYSKQLLDIEELLRVTTLLLAGAYEQKGVHLCTQFEATRTQVYSDSIRLQQVFCNLLNNALKFTEPGGLVVICTHDDGHQIRIDFTDTGAGIRPEDLERIFEPFEQCDKAEGAGTCRAGLGLPIAKGLLQALGGILLVRSPGPGRGSTFTIYLDTETEA